MDILVQLWSSSFHWAFVGSHRSTSKLQQRAIKPKAGIPPSECWWAGPEELRAQSLQPGSGDCFSLATACCQQPGGGLAVVPEEQAAGGTRHESPRTLGGPGGERGGTLIHCDSRALDIF